MAGKEIHFIREKIISEIDGGRTLSLVSWDGRPPKLDFRRWAEMTDGKLTPQKGLTLDEDEAYSLMRALQEYFAAKGRKT